MRSCRRRVKISNNKNRVQLKTVKMSKFSFCVVVLLSASAAFCDSNFHAVFKRSPSQEEFDMLIKEQGWKYTESVTFDMKKKTVVHHVPAHRNLSEANVMDDYVSNLTVTRFPKLRVCYLRSMSPEEPSLDVLKKSMNMAASQKYKMKDGFRTIATQWHITGPADTSKLSKDIIDFCGGMQVYEVEEYAKDGTKVLNAFYKTKRAISRNKRSVSFMICSPWEDVRKNLRRCNASQHIIKCLTIIRNCSHYVTCNSQLYVRNTGMCTSTRHLDEFNCCDLTCP